MKPFYITVTDQHGGHRMSDGAIVPHSFRMYVDPVKGECIGHTCLINATRRDGTAANSLIQHMVHNESGTWHHLSWERK